MAELSVDEIAQRAMALEIIAPPQLEEVWNALGTQNVGREQFLMALLRYGHLTKYQVERLAKGETEGFFYGKYKVLYSAGAGTFARVFRAVHAETGQTAAVKVLRSRYSSDPEAVSLFEREAELGMQLQHPNIVAIHGYFSEKQTHYIVMDFIEGQTLRQYTNVHKKVEYKIATRIASDICKGLDYAFKRSHLHRDMKMTNVLLSSTGKALLLDFGLAAEADTKAEQKNQRAIEYAALERSTGVRRDDKRSDIYFLGAMFYQMLSGIAPLGDIKERAQRLNKDRFFNVKPIRQVMPRIPSVLAYIVDKSMSLDPEKRYQSPAAMLVDLEHAAKKLETYNPAEEDEPAEAQADTLSPAQRAKKSSELPVVCVVESNTELQDSFRNSLKNAGYRVLIFSTVERLFERFSDPQLKVSCILLNAQTIGKKAVLAFNQLAKVPEAVEVPTILLLDENQLKWEAKTARSRWHTTVGMPVTMGRILFIINKLLTEKKALKKQDEAAPAKPKSPPPAPVPAEKPAPAPEPRQAETAAAAPADPGQISIPEAVPPKKKEKVSDEQFDLAAENIISALNDALTEPSRVPEPEPDPEEPDIEDSQIDTYPEDDEFFFDYIDDRDLE